MDTFGWIFLGIMFLVILTMIGTMSVQGKFKKINIMYSQKQNSSGKTGFQVANDILRKNNIMNVKVVKGKEGHDHYDPRKNTIALSPSVFDSRSISSSAIAAHEAGHAIRWGKKELGIRIRDTIAKPVMIVSKIGSTMMSIGMAFFWFVLIWGGNFSTIGFYLIWGGIFSYGAALIFQLATLPVEFGASKKAKRELNELEYTKTNDEIEGVKKVLNAAAMTYVMATLTTLAMLLMYILMLISRRR